MAAAGLAGALILMIGGLLKATVGAHEVFFFSSRRRHTRWPRDWSSDVCSSDLGGLRGRRRRRRRGLHDHRGRHRARGRRDHGRAGDGGGRGGRARPLPRGRGRGADRRAGRARGRVRAAVRGGRAALPGGRLDHHPDRRGRRPAGAVLEGPQVRVRRGRPDQPRLLRPGRGHPAHRARRGAPQDHRHGRGARPAGGQRLPRRGRQPAPACALRRRRRGRGGARRGAGRRDPVRLPRPGRLDHRRARRRRRQEEVPAAAVHRRRPGRHAARPLRLRPRRPLQPGQGVPHPTALRRDPGQAPRAPGRAAGAGGGVVTVGAVANDPHGGRMPEREPGAGREGAFGPRDGTVLEAGPDDAVDGARAKWLAQPSSTTETAEVLRAAHEAGLRTVVRGGGTKLGWGNPPAGVDLVLSTARLGRVLEHAAGDLVTRVEAGVRLADLQAELAPAGQLLGLDPPEAGATVGGVVAANASGPRRLRYGTVRDLLIGITVVLADGTVAHSGGKVVKNVAGYDLGKLFAGSLGTLGVIVEAIFRLHPVPAASAVVTAEVAAPGQVGAALGALPWRSGQLGVKVATGPSRLPGALTTVWEVAAAHGLAVRAAAHAGTGVLRAGLDGGDPAARAAFVTGARERLASAQATLVVTEAPLEVKRAVDAWGPVGDALPLMRRVKERFDPSGLLSPGRFVGGI